VDPDIAYARSGGVAIAYQVMGKGNVDLVYVPDYMSNLVFAMRYPRWRLFYESLATRFRLILFDKRGTGLSDHGGQFATLETRMEDMHAGARRGRVSADRGAGVTRGVRDGGVVCGVVSRTDDGTCPVPPERGGSWPIGIPHW